jgi:hypothetical protein
MNAVQNLKGTLQRASALSQGVEGAVDALANWIWENVVAHDVRPRALPSEVEQSLREIRTRLQAIQDEVNECNDELT